MNELEFATKTLKDVSIRITGPNVDQVFVTDENGRIGPIDNIVPGVYTFQEIEVPHYGYFPDINFSTSVVSGQVVLLSMRNEKQTGNLILDKKNIVMLDIHTRGVSENNCFIELCAISTELGVKRSVNWLIIINAITENNPIYTPFLLSLIP